LIGNVSSLKDFAAKLRGLPTVLAQKVATAAAPALTEAALATFSAGEDAYGASWAPGADGQKVDLNETGALARGIKYVATGTKLRVRLPVSYAKYQLGKRPAFPRQGEPLPRSYTDALEASANAVIRAELGQ